MRALLSREAALRPIPSTEPVLFLEARAPDEKRIFRCLPRWPSAHCYCWESLHHDFPADLWRSVSLAGTPNRHHAERAGRTRRSRDRARLTPMISRPPTRPTGSLRYPPEAPAPSRFHDVSEENLLARAALAPSRWSDCVASTQNVFHRIDHLRACTRKPRRPWILIWITRTTRTPFRRWVLPQAASGGYPRSPSTSAQVTHTALRRCMTHARDACDRFLPSTASISSTRVSFALGEVPASRLRTTSVSACAARPETNIRAPSGFTPPEWLWWMSNDILRSSNHCRACRAPSMCQLADPSVVAHTSKLRLERCATWSVKTSPFCDLARLPSKSAFLRPTSCDACRAPPGVDLMSRACPAFVGFAANVPSSTPFHRYDAMLLSQTRLYRLGPRSHPRIWLMRMLLWARRSFSTSATSFQNTTHEHEHRERCPRPPQGLALQSLPRTMRF